MAYATQPTLFDDTAVMPQVDDSAFDRATDHQLDEHSWITHLSGLVVGHRRLIEELVAVATSEQRQRWMFNRIVDEPRLTAEYTDLAAAPAFLADLTASLSSHLAIPYDGIWINWYRDHHDGTRGTQTVRRTTRDRRSSSTEPWRCPPIPDPPRRRWQERSVHTGWRRPADYAGAMPTRLAAQRSQTEDARRASDQLELQQSHAVVIAVCGHAFSSANGALCSLVSGIRWYVNARASTRDGVAVGRCRLDDTSSHGIANSDRPTGDQLTTPHPCRGTHDRGRTSSSNC
jgi:hypothetical protein